MEIRPSRITRLKSFIFALMLLALPLIATAQNESGTPFFAAGEDGKNSFLIVQAGETELKVEAIGADGSLIDTYTITRATRAKQ